MLRLIECTPLGNLVCRVVTPFVLASKTQLKLESKKSMQNCDAAQASGSTAILFDTLASGQTAAN
tara:strand:+ start:16268 stop:16462 length:195 start_codon:yes stop_codon:yes gene_type:complete